jgi:acyl-CoA synthetase (AMP-forming)/AMP-acid ligase II
MSLTVWYDNWDEKYFLDVAQNGCTILTSGSSGEPKSIWQPPEKIYANTLAAIEVQELTKDSTVYTCLNPVRAGALFAQTIPALHVGAEVHLAKFNPYEYVRVADKYTHTHLTPKQAKAVMLTKGFKDLDLKNKIFLVGSEPVTFDIIEAFVERGAIVITIWGMTEIGVNAILHKFRSVFDIVAAKSLAPPNSTILGNIFYCDWKVDENNCLWVKGDMCVFDDWFNTKDQVVVDDKWGWLWYTGRDGTPVDFNNPRKG